MNRTSVKLRIGVIACLAAFAVSTVGFSGCKDDSKDDNKTEQNGNGNGNGNNGNQDDNTTVAGRLKKAGLTLDAVKPDTRFAEAGFPEYGDSEKRKVVLYLTGSEALGAEWQETYFKKLAAVFASVSSDKKFYKPYYGAALGVAEEFVFSGNENWGAMIFVMQGSYKYNGKVTVTVGTSPTEKEGYTYEVSFAFNFYSSWD